MRIRGLLFAGCLCAIFLFAQSINMVGAREKKKVYSLNESIAEALANNWKVRAKKEKINESTYVKEQARADFFPKVSTTYGYTRLDNVEKTAPTSLGALGTIPGRELNTLDNFQWKTTLSQTLFAGYSLISAYELGKLGIEESSIDFELEKLDLALEVKEAYFNILKMDRAVEVASEAVKALESHVRVAESFYKVGMSPINDLLKAEVELANAKHVLVKAENASKLARSFFNVVLAKPVNEPVEVEDLITYTPEGGDFNKFVQRALRNRPEIKTIDVNLLQADQQIRLAKSDFYPKASLNYDYIKDGDEFGVSGSELHDKGRWQVMASLSWTFWEWGKTRSAVRGKKSFRDQLMNTRSSLVDSIKLQIKQAILDLEQEEKNIPTTKKAVEQGEENLRVNEERYKAQVTTITEVLDAQTLLTQARVNYYGALYDRGLAKARLLRALGEY